MKMSQQIQTEICVCSKLKRVGKPCASCGSGPVSSTTEAERYDLNEVLKATAAIQKIITARKAQ